MHCAAAPKNSRAITDMTAYLICISISGSSRKYGSNGSVSVRYWHINRTESSVAASLSSQTALTACVRKGGNQQESKQVAHNKA